jgi:hypothetical protein
MTKEQADILARDTKIEGLRESIEHWQRLATGKRQPNEHHYGDDCPLCQRYWKIDDSDDSDCSGCPIRDDTGADGCEGCVPWNAANDCIKNTSAASLPPSCNGDVYQTVEFKRAAADMVVYLQRLLTKYENPS